MSATEVWAQAKASGMAQNIHPETAKNMGINQPIEIPKVPENKPAPTPPAQVPAPERRLSWLWIVHLIYLAGLAYCIYLLHRPRVVTKTETIEVEKIVEKPVERVVTKYVDRPVPIKDNLPKVTIVSYVTNCSKYRHPGTCEQVMSGLRLAQAKRVQAIKEGKQPETTIVL